MTNVIVQQRIDLPAAFGGSVLVVQQDADLIQRHVQAAAMTDESQAVGVRVVIDAIVAFRARWRWKQVFPLVVADGFDLRSGGSRQLSRFSFHASA